MTAASARHAGRMVEALLEELSSRLDPAAAGNLAAVVGCRVRLPDGTRVDRTATIAEGRCRIDHDDDCVADVTLEIGFADVLRLASGETTAARLFVRQRLVLEGDVLLASRLPGFFRGARAPADPRSPRAGLSRRTECAAAASAG